MTSISRVLAIALLAVSIGPAVVIARPQHVQRAIDWTKVIVSTPQGGMRMGNPSAPVKLVEFGSRVCSHCARFAAEGVPALKADYIATGKVSYEFRDYPVAGAVDLGPILLGRCVPAGRYFTVLDRMFEAQDALLEKLDAVADSLKSEARPNDIARRYAEGLGYLDLMQRAGFDRARLLACLNDPRGIARIVAETRVATQQHKVRGTPTFEINGKGAPGVFDWSGLRPRLDAALR